MEIIRQYEEEYDNTLGYRMMTDIINREKNKNYNDKLIYKIMSRVHCYIDNGPMEEFWGILKCEAYKEKHFDTKEELIEAIEKWIDYYTNRRYQRRFGVRTPAEVRSEALTSEEPAYYPISENKQIEKYKMEHYKYNTDSMTAQL